MGKDLFDQAKDAGNAELRIYENSDRVIRKTARKAKRTDTVFPTKPKKKRKK